MIETDKIAAVFVFNKSYLRHFYRCCHQLVENGRFTGDIVAMIGDDLSVEEVEMMAFEIKIHIVKFPEIDLPPHVVDVIRSLKTGDDRHLTKMFQWHKINLFRTFFRRWDYVLYLDANFNITGDIAPILDQRERGKIVAHDDDFPVFVRVLGDQFDRTSEPFQRLSRKYDTNCRYFQTGLMLFDTGLITETTFWELQDLILRYPCCGSNDQGFISLYFASIKKCWKPLTPGNGEIFYYDNFRRDKSRTYIVYKGA